MHRHEAHDVVGGLGDTRVLGVGRPALLGEPARERAQPAAASRGEGARLLDELREVRGRLAAVPAGERDLDQLRATHRLTHEPRERGPRAEAVQVEKLGKGVATDSGLSVVSDR